MMGGGAGNVLDMIVRYRYNRSQLNRRSRFSRKKSLVDIRQDYLKAIENGPVEFKTATREQIKQIRQQVVADHRRQRIRVTVVTLVITAIFGALAISYASTLDFNSMAGQQAKQEQGPTKAELDEQYLFFMRDGDTWLKKTHWHNAIWQYKQALEVYPQSFDARQRLALAYTMRCREEEQNCEEAAQLVQTMMAEDPDNRDLNELWSLYTTRKSDEDSTKGGKPASSTTTAHPG